MGKFKLNRFEEIFAQIVFAAWIGLFIFDWAAGHEAATPYWDKFEAVFTLAVVGHIAWYGARGLMFPAATAILACIFEGFGTVGAFMLGWFLSFFVVYLVRVAAIFGFRYAKMRLTELQGAPRATEQGGMVSIVAPRLPKHGTASANQILHGYGLTEE